MLLGGLSRLVVAEVEKFALGGMRRIEVVWASRKRAAAKLRLKYPCNSCSASALQYQARSAPLALYTTFDYDQSRTIGAPE